MEDPVLTPIPELTCPDAAAAATPVMAGNKKQTKNDKPTNNLFLLFFNSPNTYTFPASMLVTP